MNLVLGLTGSFGSGCTTIAQILSETQSYYFASLSAPIKQVAKDKGLKEDRGTLQQLGNELRKAYGREYLARQAVERAKDALSKGPLVLDGIRNMGEVAWLRSQFPAFFLIAVDARYEVRWARLRTRYGKNEGAFEEEDERDRGEPDLWGQQVAACVDAADAFLLNEEDFSDDAAVKKAFTSKLVDYVSLMNEPGRRRPDHDELLMDHAYSASLRSDCLKRQVGAVIATSDHAVVASGYNNVPHCEASCQERYEECYRDKIRSGYYALLDKLKCRCGEALQRVDSCSNCGADLRPLHGWGKALDYCRALHAEERAILQVSRFGGVGLQGTTIYTTTFPCLMCANKIVHAGIAEVVYVEAYPMKEATALLQNAGVAVRRFEGIKAQAFHNELAPIKWTPC